MLRRAHYKLLLSRLVPQLTSGRHSMKHAFSFLVLAGGQGSRMGGADKGLVVWQGKPLIRHIHDTIRPFTDDLIISCNRNRREYLRYSDQIIGDAESGFPGPLAGVIAGMAIARHDRCVLLPCDAPGVDSTLINELMLTGRRTSAAVMLRQGNQWQPMFSVIPKGYFPALQTAWNEGQRSLMRVLLTLDVQPLDIPEDDSRLDNINSLEQLGELTS